LPETNTPEPHSADSSQPEPDPTPADAVPGAAAATDPPVVDPQPDERRGTDVAAESTAEPDVESVGGKGAAPEPSPPPLGVLAAALAAGLVALAGWSYLSVPILAALGVYLLFPYRRQDWGRRLLAAVGVVTLCWLATEAKTVLAPFVVAALLAYLGDPIVDRLETWGLARTPAIFALLVPIGGAAVLCGMWLVPLLVGEIGRLAEQVPAAGATALAWARVLVERIPTANWDLEWEAYLGEIAEYGWAAARQVATGAVSVGRGVGAVVSLVSYVVLTPILAFYLLRDWDRIIAALDQAIAPGSREVVRRVARRMDEILGAYFRGQGLVCVAIGLLTSGGLLLLGVDFALLLGIVAGLFNLVPVIGLIASVVPAIAVALLSPDPVLTSVKVLGVFGVVQLLEQALLSPRLVGDRVGLHPALVMLAILVFPIFWGFVGVLVAVPAMAAFGVLIEELRRASND